MSINLDKTIYNLTSETEKLTIEWVFKAIDKVNELLPKVYKKEKRIL